MDKNWFIKFISLDRSTVNPYAGLQVAGLVTGNLREIPKLTLQWERHRKMFELTQHNRNILSKTALEKL
ncbi:MAG TPA: hypothetical protein VE130_11770 [Nitrososphaeraceae archaeon]|nr:hypothetical protein [Nitrososphaeraceae archaeon]